MTIQYDTEQGSKLVGWTFEERDVATILYALKGLAGAVAALDARGRLRLRRELRARTGSDLYVRTREIEALGQRMTALLAALQEEREETTPVQSLVESGQVEAEQLQLTLRDLEMVLIMTGVLGTRELARRYEPLWQQYARTVAWQFNRPEIAYDLGELGGLTRRAARLLHWLGQEEDEGGYPA